MSGQEFNSYIGTVHSSIYGTTGEYLCTSVSLNFESDRVALGTSNVQNYTGNVYIYDYNGTSWTKNFSLSGPDGQNSSFGHDVSFNWSGTRLAISAYQVNKVYILDATGTGTNIWSSYVSNTLNTSSLSLPGSAEFGYSISLAQDDGNRIAIGAPGQNKVYVYEYNSANNNWGSGPVWSSTDSGINNVLAYAVDSSGLATSYVHAHAISNRYGHKVRLTGFGNYLIIGAPGETDATINSTTAYYPEGSTTNYTGSYTGQNQIGHVRCYTNDGDTWASGTTQYGQDIRGKAGIELGNSNGQQPGFGTSCDISTNGNKIVVSSPYKYVETYDAGQIDTYLINDDLDTWLSVSTSITGTKIQKNLGMNVRLDYAGERLATGDLQQDGQIQQSQWYSGISLFAFDFGTDRWYDITKPIQLLDWPTYSDEERNPLDITNGKIIAISNPRYPAYNNPPPGTQGSVIFYQFPITQNIQGNMLVGGYLKCENFYVGANDSSTNTDHTTESKRISFGGTVVDNAYDQTYIENRSVDGTGKSELLLYKRNDMYDREGGNPASSYGAVDDTIRLKAAEICLDYEDANYHGAGDNAGQRTTRFLLNRSGQIALGNAYYNGEFDVVTDIDVNDKSFFWTTVNIGNKTNKPPSLTPALNTNNERLFLGLSTSSTPIGTDGKYGNQQFERYNVSSQAWDGDEFAFYFSNSDATIYEDSHPGNWHGSNGQFSCWIKLNDTQANCAGVLAWFGHDLHRTGTSYRGGWVKLTSSGLQFEYEANSANVQTVSYTFNQGSWYHVAVCFPTENTYPSASSSKWPKVKIDNVIQTISANPGSAYSSGVEFDNSAYGFGSFLTFSRDSNGNVIFSGEIPVVSGSENNGVKNCWIALMDIGNGDIDSNELYKVLPGEMLTVGGICTITKYLGIGVSSPKYQLDVDGNINFTGKLYNNEIELLEPYSNVLTLQSSNTFITPLTSTAGVYPLVAMTSNSSGPHVASASSEYNSSWEPRRAFDKTVDGGGWHSATSIYNSSDGSYSGSTSTTYDGSSTVNGEWIQLQFTTGIAINKIEIAPRTNYVNRCAGDGILLGSNDGSTWTSIHSFSGQTYTNGTYNSITFTTSPVYTYFRLVVTNLAGTGHDSLNISEIRYTGVTLYENYVYYTGNVAIGTSSTPSYKLDVTGDINCTGALSKGSGSFKIDHPLPNMSNTHYLYHSFIEGPQADLIYRGVVDLVNGSASVNLDTVSNMTDGTFEALNRNVQCFVSNESDWDALKGSVSGNILTVSCQNTSSTAKVSWMVVGERKDKHMYDTGWTDNEGCVVPEKLK